MDSHTHISVIIPTRNRAREVERALSSLQEQRMDGLGWEILLVDNGSENDTRSVQHRSWPGLNIVPLYEPIAGKSRAINGALEVARGDLIVFTDDDITAVSVWLAHLHLASLKFEVAPMFCGPIVARFPAETPEWLSTHSDLSGFFGMFEPQSQEGPLPPKILPFGANFAVRRSEVRHRRFREDLGPSSENGRVIGEDTDFMSRILEHDKECIYVPSAVVYHHISSSQIDQRWIFERAFHLGRASQFLRRKPPIQIDVHSFDVGPGGDEEIRRFQLGGLLNYYTGQLCECRLSGESESHQREIWNLLDLLGVNSCRHLLSESGRTFFDGEGRASQNVHSNPRQ